MNHITSTTFSEIQEICQKYVLKLCDGTVLKKGVGSYVSTFNPYTLNTGFIKIVPFPERLTNEKLQKFKDASKKDVTK